MRVILNITWLLLAGFCREIVRTDQIPPTSYAS